MAPYDRVPYFLSDQYEVVTEYRGLARRWDQVVFRGDPARREFIAFWLHEGRLPAAMNVKVWDIGEAIEPLLAARAAVETRALEDPEIRLASLSAAIDARLFIQLRCEKVAFWICRALWGGPRGDASETTKEETR